MSITIKEPSMLNKHWKWKVTIRGKVLSGKAATEREAWRLANDADKLLTKSLPIEPTDPIPDGQETPMP